MIKFKHAVQTAIERKEFEQRAQELMNIFAQVLPDEFGSVHKENEMRVNSPKNPPKRKPRKKVDELIYKSSSPEDEYILKHMKDVFEICNTRFFENKLKTPRFALAHKIGYNGLFDDSNSKIVVRNGNDYYIRKNQPTIVFNKDKYDEGENFFWSVMLHEMVHQWVFMTHDYNPKLSHGVEFKACCARLKEKYGVIVTTYHNNEAIPNLEEMVNKIKEKKYE